MDEMAVAFNDYGYDVCKLFARFINTIYEHL